MEIRTLCDVFYKAVSFEKPDHLKVKRGGSWRDFSSADFRKAVEELSAGLRELGIEGGDRVAILSENQPEWAFADLATLCAAGVDVPIYPTLPPEQVLYILNDSEAKVLFVSTATQAKKVAEIRSRTRHVQHVIRMDDGAGEGTITLSDVRARGAKVLASDPGAVKKRAAEVGPDDLATLIYTSGTTGLPKGVMLTHGNLVSNTKAAAKIFVLGRDDVALSFLPLSHVFERMAGYYLMLLGGVTIAYAESIEMVAANMGEVRPTLMCSVPRLYEKMYAKILDKIASDPPTRQKIARWAFDIGRDHLRHRVERHSPGAMLGLQKVIADKLVFGKIRERTGGRLRLFVSGGAPLSREIAEFFGAAGLMILEGYGLTETSPVITCNRPEDFKPGTVGKVLDGIEVKIAPDGEILTRGPHVMRGYYNKPEDTAATIDADGWLHTGDVGSFDDDGFLTITDRKKDIIVTSGGKNLAPAPIENVLKTDPLVAEFVMVGNKRNFPAALVVPNFDNLEKWAKEQKIGFKDRRDLVGKADVVRYYEDRVSELTQGLAQFEKIKKIALLPREFSVDSGELTPTLKVKRRVVEEKYKDVIDQMYGAA